MTRTYPIALIVIALTACHGVANDRDGAAEEGADVEESRRPTDPGDRLLEVATVEGSLAAGVTAGIRLENLSDRTIGFNLCPRILERRIDGTWTELPETRPEACTLELRILAAGDTIVETTGILPGLEAGTYRIVFEGISFEEGDPAVPLAQRTTNAFQIE